MTGATMKSTLQRALASALALALASAGAAMLLSGPAGAAVIATLGSGTAVKTVTNAAHFELNTAMASGYVEDGLLFSYTGSANNNGCGYAGVNCYDAPADLSPAFSGNYMASSGNNAYISIRLASGLDFYKVEFAADTSYLNLNGYWKTFNDSVQTGAGNFSRPHGAVLGLADGAGFDEVRYYAFSTANRQSGFSGSAIDEVRVGVPEPASVLLMAVGLLGLTAVRRKRTAAGTD